MEREDSGRSGEVEICGNAEHMKDGGRSAATEVNNSEAKGTRVPLLLVMKRGMEKEMEECHRTRANG
jgi:hypothetical protein